ncbi:MAG TPA: PadR family transcriptional regulator [Thermoanaerobaculia bacterium]|nr:PadR family transcriptional regulator [Thermoanaerobaculia bacterium]
MNFSRKIKDMDIPRLSSKEAIILQLLISNGEMYGLEMVGAAPDKIKRGTVYVTLGRMAEKGYVESRQVPGDEGTGGLPRRLFQATGYGARVLHAWELASSTLAVGAIP